MWSANPILPLRGAGLKPDRRVSPIGNGEDSGRTRSCGIDQGLRPHRPRVHERSTSIMEQCRVRQIGTARVTSDTVVAAMFGRGLTSYIFRAVTQRPDRTSRSAIRGRRT
jgi:hypothetical protein